MSEPNDLPVARFSPAPGLFVDRTEKAVAVTGAMELFGPEATGSRAGMVRHSINTVWTATFSDGYSVSCNISVNYRPPGVAATDASQIEAIRIVGPSHVSAIDRSMTLNANETDAFTWTAAHEFGHVLGLKDRYSEGIMSKLRSRFGGTRASTVDPRYQSNLMAVDQGVLESQNVQDLGSENEPSPYWFNDDDVVREWINHHVIAEVGHLSGSNKIKMINTLMGGWVSDEDVAAIARVCSAVGTRAEAQKIRAEVNLVNLSSLGQRTRVRAFFSMMP